MSRIYDYPLVSWICAGLHRSTLDAVIEGIKKDQPIDAILPRLASNTEYINKILREEVLKQFAHSDRPVVEVILNSVDAKPAGLDREYLIKVDVSGNKITTIDNGTGMSLDQILRLLIIPFNTEKTGLDEIGRFGVGFLSCLNYCMEGSRNLVGLTTKTGEEGYNLIFYSPTARVEGLQLAIRKTWRYNPAGTGVLIRRRIVSKRSLCDYIKENVKGIPTYRARIMLNDKPVDDDSKMLWYTQPAALDVRGKKMVQEVGLRIRLGYENEDKNGLSLTSQGVLVRKFSNSLYHTIISFPAGVQLVEGRDEFKKDHNYHSCVQATFAAMQTYIQAWQEQIHTKKEKSASEEEFQTLLALVPGLMSAFELKNIREVANIDELRAILLPGKKYVLTEYELADFSAFFGTHLRDIAFEAKYGAHRYWSDIYAGSEKFLDDSLTVTDTFTPFQFRERMALDPSFLPNLSVMAKIKEVPFESLSLVHTSTQMFPTTGPSPYLLHQKKILINQDHPYVSGPFNPVKAYACTADFLALNVMIAQFSDPQEEKAESLLQSLMQKRLFPHQHKSGEKDYLLS